MGQNVHQHQMFPSKGKSLTFILKLVIFPCQKADTRIHSINTIENNNRSQRGEPVDMVVDPCFSFAMSTAVNWTQWTNGQPSMADHTLACTFHESPCPAASCFRPDQHALSAGRFSALRSFAALTRSPCAAPR